MDFDETKVDHLARIRQDQHGILAGDKDINVLIQVDRTLPIRITTDSGEVSCQLQFARKFMTLLIKGGDTIKAISLKE